MIEIGRLGPDDRAAWEVLARGDKAFYQDPETDEAYEAHQETNVRARALYDQVARSAGFIRYAYPL